MEALNTVIENQYHSTGLYEDILKRLEEQIVLQSGIYVKSAID